MSNGWIRPDKYEHLAITGATGPGTMYDGYAWKWVNHSTEGPPGSIAGTISLFQASPGSCPHFMIDPMGTGRRIQHIPWVWSACALRGGANGYQTNRGRAVQVEICGYARDAAHWPDDALWTIADTIADVILDGCPINPDNTPDSSLLRGTLATVSSPQRMSWGFWQTFDGIAAHVYVPNNDHWDVGALNNLKIGQYVRDILAGAGRTVVPRPASGTLPRPAANPQPGYLVKGMVGGQITQLQTLLAGLDYSVGWPDGIFGSRTELAVAKFQSDSGIASDGIVGPVTASRLSAAYAGLNGRPALPPPPNPNVHPAWPERFFVLTTPLMQGNDIRTWQTQMAKRGWHLTADGFYGKESFSICKSFQQDKGLTCDGICGPQTWAAAWTAAIT